MISAMRENGDADEYPPKRARIVVADVQNQHLEDFPTTKSLKFFTCLNLKIDFLEKDPSEWGTDSTFNRAYEVVCSLRVVNDNAERGVALITEYNRLITCDEEQKQYLLQIVADHRKTFPDCKKKTLKRKI